MKPLQQEVLQVRRRTANSHQVRTPREADGLVNILLAADGPAERGWCESLFGTVRRAKLRSGVGDCCIATFRLPRPYAIGQLFAMVPATRQG